MGVRATGFTSGLALHVLVLIRIEVLSGVATSPVGAQAKTVSFGGGITERTFVLLTPMENIGSRSLWFTKTCAPTRSRSA